MCEFTKNISYLNIWGVNKLRVFIKKSNTFYIKNIKIQMLDVLKFSVVLFMV